jgi:hypothetical protein
MKLWRRELRRYIMTQSYPVYQGLWEAFDAVLFNKGNSLAREIAKELDVDPKVLLQHLKTIDHGKFTILPEDTCAQYQCQALIPHGATMIRCRRPVLGSAPRFCCAHERYSPDPPKGLPTVQRVITEKEAYMKLGTNLYTLNGSRVGYLKSDNTAVVFEIES